MSAELVAFLRARVDDDERDARANRGVFPSPSVEDSGAVWMHIRPGGNAVITCYPHPAEGYDDMAKLRNWADTETGWTQHRVLAEVAAKRRILARHRPYDGPLKQPSWALMCEGCGWHTARYEPRTADINACPELQDLALLYASHPDYRQEWAPTD